MTTYKMNPHTGALLLMIAATGAARVLFHFSQEISPLAFYSPIGAMALFGGACFDKPWKAFGFPLLTLFISDLVLQQAVYKSYDHGFLYQGWYWVYSAFILMTLTGRGIMSRLTTARFILSVLACVLIHWLITDMGVCVGSNTYAHTLAGYLDSLVAAIPFELRFLAGTLVYGVILFGSYEWMRRRQKQNIPVSR